MKKVCCAIFCILSVLASLTACGGKISGAKTFDVESDLYSQEDIASAIDVIKREFKSNWSGCTLTEIYYAGDEASRSYQERAEKNDAFEAIVLLSSFDVDSTGGDGSLNPDSTYTRWKWILVRAKGEEWRHIDHGY